MPTDIVNPRDLISPKVDDNDQVGLGLDVVEIARIEAVLARSASFKRIFSAEEQAYCDATSNPATHYATRFAAREAVAKALGTGLYVGGVLPKDIEVCRSHTGKPYVRLSGRVAELARELGVLELPISLSYTHQEAVACAMAITRGSQSAAQARKDPMEELTKQFKSARAMLDEL